ncbi:sugar ABC transporter permease [Microbacterium sp. X-17]|uniref:carbohydrate ABC transporter permease n=1 Tax=Microbacterium sp. X-17 TaxID=3144404 RepID=UPI0031F59C7F
MTLSLKTAGGRTSGPLRGTLSTRRRPRTRIRRWLSALPFIGPTWLLVVFTGILPLVFALWLSVTNQGPNAAGNEFVGLQNYLQAVFTPSFGESLAVTAIFVVFGVVLQFVIAYALASFLYLELRFFQVARTILLIPITITPVIVGLMFRFMFTPDIGVVFFAEKAIGINIPWFTDPLWGRVFIIMLDTWLTTPFLVLMILAGMSGLSAEPLEAASLDGAGWWQRTRFVTLPMLLPVITVALLVRIVDAARMFDQVYSSTRGGPGTSTLTVSILAYNDTFQYFEFGHGAAIAIALTVLMFPVYFFYIRLTKV